MCMGLLKGLLLAKTYLDEQHDGRCCCQLLQPLLQVAAILRLAARLAQRLQGKLNQILGYQQNCLQSHCFADMMYSTHAASTARGLLTQRCRPRRTDHADVAPHGSLIGSLKRLHVRQHI